MYLMIPDDATPDEVAEMAELARQLAALRRDADRAVLEEEPPRHPDAYCYGELWGPDNPAPGSPWTVRELDQPPYKRPGWLRRVWTQLWLAVHTW